MRKLLILASLAFIGVACCKSDDDNNNNNNNKAPDPWEEKVILPTKYIIEYSADSSTEMVYTVEDGFIKEAKEYEISGSERKEVKHLIIKPLKGKFSMSITFDYKDGKLSKFAPIPSVVYNLTYPDAHTVVATGDSGYDTYIYTFSPEGNLIKKVYDNLTNGVVSFRKTYLYEYDLQKKNPKRNLQIQLITLANTPLENYTFYELYEATNSKNLVVKVFERTQQLEDSNNPSLGLTKGSPYLSTEYKNEANNPQGYATKITKVTDGNDGTIEKYEY